MTDKSTPFAIGSTVWPGLSKLVEEMGEVLQVAGKTMGTGGLAMHWDGSDLRKRLEEEIADTMAAIRFFTEHNGLDEERIAQRAEQKYKLFCTWHEHREK